MATAGKEIQLLKGGSDQDGLVRGVWAQNVWRSNANVSVRPGWGQVTELDTTLGLNYNISEIGYQKHHGSILLETSFGHEQILSVFSGRAASGEGVGLDLQPRWNRYYFVRIYDLTTNKSWEELLYHQTAENVPLRGLSAAFLDTLGTSYESEWHGNYSTTYDVDNAAFINGEVEHNFFFHTFQGEAYFGAPTAGIYIYRPADFRHLKRQQLSSAQEFDWHNGLSESSLIKRLSLSDGIYRDGFIYATNSSISTPRAACSFRGRLVIATNNEVWFSDPGKPDNFIGINSISVPSDSQVTAIHSLKGNLVIFTDSEMFVYVPSEGKVVSQGRPPVRVTDSIGCVGPQALTYMEGSLVWAGHSGIYATSNGSSPQELSEPVRSFWSGNGLMTNPVTSYFETAIATVPPNPGFVDIRTITPPRTLLEFDPENISLAYYHKRRSLFMGVPNINGIWSFDGMWSWWPTESVASETGGAPEVNTKSNLVAPVVLASREAVYLVTGLLNDTIADSGETWIDGNPTGSLPVTSGNFVIARLGLGGGLDRSCETEDHRLGSGKYVAAMKGAGGSNAGIWYFDDPIYDDGKYWVPVYLVPPEPSLAVNVFDYEIFFAFDKTNFSADEGAGPGHAITLRYPTERMGSAGSTVTAAVTDATKAPASDGGHIHIRWTGSAGAAWGHQPNLNLSKRNKNPILYFSMRPITPASSVAGFGIRPFASDMAVNGPVLDPNRISGLRTQVWCRQFIGTTDSHKNNAKVQAVDWAYKSNEESAGGLQIRARGIYATLFSHGRAELAERIIPNWAWGVYNVLLGSDYKDYVSQVVDFDGNIEKIEDKLTIRSRFRNAAGNMTTRTFNGDPKWGDAATPAAGNYLIDDEEQDTIATSDSVKGQRISYMVFGFIRNRAESLSIKSLMGVFRQIGGRRRTGR